MAIKSFWRATTAVSYHCPWILYRQPPFSSHLLPSCTSHSPTPFDGTFISTRHIFPSFIPYQTFNLLHLLKSDTMPPTTTTHHTILTTHHYVENQTKYSQNSYHSTILGQQSSCLWFKHTFHIGTSRTPATRTLSEGFRWNAIGKCRTMAQMYGWVFPWISNALLETVWAGECNNHFKWLHDF